MALKFLWQTLRFSAQSTGRNLDIVAASTGRMLGMVAEVLLWLVFPADFEFRPRARRAAGERATPPSVGHRLVAIGDELRKSGAEAESLIAEATELLSDRVRRIEQAQAEIARLEADAAATAKQLADLKAVKPEAAAALASLVDDSMDAREKRAGRRDLVLFVLGVVTTVIVDFLRSALFGG